MKRWVLAFAAANVLVVVLVFGAYLRQPDTTCYIDAARRIIGQAGAEDCGYRLLKPLPVLTAGMLEQLTGLHPMYGLFAQNVIFYILASLLLFEIVRITFGDKRQGLIAAVMLGTAPPFLVFGLAYLTDMMGWFWAILGVYLTLRASSRPHAFAWAFLIGLVAGIGFLYKESALGGLLFFGAYTLLHQHVFWREKIKRCFFAGLGFALPIGISTAAVYWAMGYTFFDWLLFAWSKPFGDEYQLFYFAKNIVSVLNIYWLFAVYGVYALFRAYHAGRVPFQVTQFLAAGGATLLLWFAWSYPAARIFYLSAPLLLALASYGAIALGPRRGTSLFAVAVPAQYALVWYALAYPYAYGVIIAAGALYALVFAAALIGFARAGIAAGAAVLIFATGEMGLRAAGYSGERIERDPRTGFMTFIPGSSFVFKKPCLENNVQINSAGFHDFEFTREKKPGTVRVAVLGDSYIEALHVPREKAFHNLLEEKLNAAFGDSPRFEVYALGMSGNGTFSNYLYLKQYALQYQPDMVINAFLIGNDFRNDSAELSTESGLTAPTLFPAWDATGRLDVAAAEEAISGKVANPMITFIKKIARRSAFVTWAYPRYYAAKAQLARGFSSASASLNAPSEFSVDDQVFLKDYPDVWQAAWRDEEALLLAMKKAAEEAGARFSFMSLTEGFRVHPTLMEARGFSERELSALDFEKPERLLQGIAARHQIPYLPLLPFFRAHEADSEEHTVFPCDGHWNERGHALAAEALFNFLTRHFPLPRPS